MRLLLTTIILSLLFGAGCSHQTSSGPAPVVVPTKYKPKIGKTRKQDLQEQFGDPDWCIGDGTGEICRFRRGTQQQDARHRDIVEELVVGFDAQGVLKGIKSGSPHR